MIDYSDSEKSELQSMGSPQSFAAEEVNGTQQTVIDNETDENHNNEVNEPIIFEILREENDNLIERLDMLEAMQKEDHKIALNITSTSEINENGNVHVSKPENIYASNSQITKSNDNSINKDIPNSTTINESEAYDCANKDEEKYFLPHEVVSENDTTNYHSVSTEVIEKNETTKNPSALEFMIIDNDKFHPTHPSDSNLSHSLIVNNNPVVFSEPKSKRIRRLPQKMVAYETENDILQKKNIKRNSINSSSSSSPMQIQRNSSELIIGLHNDFLSNKNYVTLPVFCPIQIPYPGEEDFLFSFEQHKYHPVCLMNSEGIVQVQKQIKLEMIITFSHLNDNDNDTMSSSNKKQKNRTSSNNPHTDIVECISTGPVAPLKVTGVYWFKCLKPYAPGIYTLTFKSSTHPEINPLKWDIVIPVPGEDEENANNNVKSNKRKTTKKRKLTSSDLEILDDSAIKIKNIDTTAIFIKKLNFDITSDPRTLVKHFIGRIFEYDGKKKLYYGYLAGFNGSHFLVVYNDGDSQRLNEREVRLSLINDEDVPDKAIKACLDHIISGNYLQQESLDPI